VERQLQHLVRITDDLLDVARIRHGKMHLLPSSTSATRTVEGRRIQDVAGLSVVSELFVESWGAGTPVVLVQGSLAIV